MITNANVHAIRNTGCNFNFRLVARLLLTFSQFEIKRKDVLANHKETLVVSISNCKEVLAPAEYLGCSAYSI